MSRKLSRGCWLLVCMFFCQSVLAQSKKVIATVQMLHQSPDPNLIGYRSSRPLTIDDFQGPPEPEQDAVAMAYSGVSVKYQGYIKNGITYLEITVFASFNKSKSWCLPDSRNDWTLAHEQRHFDITALNACALYQELRSLNFTANFEQQIHELDEKYRIKNAEEQDEYDGNTRHGIKRSVQQEYNKTIPEKIAASGDCFD